MKERFCNNQVPVGTKMRPSDFCLEMRQVILEMGQILFRDGSDDFGDGND